MNDSQLTPKGFRPSETPHLGIFQAVSPFRWPAFLVWVTCAGLPARGGDAPNEAKAPVAPAEEKSPFSVSLSLQGGYDSNALQLPKHLPIDDAPHRRGFAFFEGTVKTSYEKEFSPGKLSINYSFTKDIYDAAIDNNFDDHDWSASFGKDAADPGQWGWKIGVEDDYTRYDEEPFYNDLIATGTVTHRWSGAHATSLGYEYHYKEFFSPSAPVSTQDANIHVAVLSHECKLAEDYTLTLEYVHRWQEARGDDYDLGRNQLSAILAGKLDPREGTFLHSIDFSITYVHQWDFYRNENSNVALRYRRENDNDTVKVKLSREITPRVSVEAVYKYVKEDSNIITRAYDEHIVQGGVKISFP